MPSGYGRGVPVGNPETGNLPWVEIPETDDLPLRVVPDWDAQVERAEAVCRLIDRHLDAEARGRILRELTDFRPEHLCPEQKVQMVTDCYAVVCDVPVTRSTTTCPVLL